MIDPGAQRKANTALIWHKNVVKTKTRSKSNFYSLVYQQNRIKTGNIQNHLFKLHQTLAEIQKGDLRHSNRKKYKYSFANKLLKLLSLRTSFSRDI